MACSAPQPRIYLVEDSPIICNLLAELIQATGATIIGHADNAQTALAEIDALRPDVITVDVLLKKGSGFDVLKEIGRKKPGDAPVCVVLTNYGTPAYRDAAQRLGVKYFFDKATEIREVLTVLASLPPNVNKAAVAPQASHAPAQLFEERR
jgi:DNA-binding NarL/FixJ family response regulator